MGARALLIGNWDYGHPDGGMATLRGPRHDVAHLKEALTHPTLGMFKDGEIDVRENLTADALSDALSETIAASRPGDLLLIYYSGHGERLGASQQLGLLGVDVPYERRLNRALPADMLRSWLEEARASSKVIVLDCCYSGQFRGDIVDDDVLATFGTGTVVLASGGNQVVPDEGEQDGPSAFTKALATVLVDPSLPGSDGILTAEDVYAALDGFVPRLQPRPHRNLDAQGRIGLARRPGAAREDGQIEVRGWPDDLRVVPVDLTLKRSTVVASWDRDENGRITTDERDVTALDGTRLAAIRRLCELADAVMRAKDYGEPSWQRRARGALETAGANLFEAALPRAVQRLLAEADDEVVVQLNLTFEPPWAQLSEFPWEFLNVPAELGVEHAGLAQRRLVVSRTGPPQRLAAREPDIVDVAVVSSVAPRYARMPKRLGAELVAMPKIRTLATPDDRPATWAQLLEAVDQKPDCLVVCAPLLRVDDHPPTAKLGFGGGPETDWRTAESLADELRRARGLRAVVLASVAAEAGLDAIRAAPMVASVLNAELGVPVVFICHTPGLEAYVDDSDPHELKTFIGLLLAALASGKDLVRSVWFARDRVLRYIPAELQPTFGVPGFFLSAASQARASVHAERSLPKFAGIGGPGKAEPR